MYAAIRVVAPIGFWAHAGFIPLFYLMGVPLMALFNVGSVLCWAAAGWFNRRGRRTTAMLLIAFEVALHAVCAVLLIGWDSGFHYYLIPVLPFLLFDDRSNSNLIVVASVMVPLIYLGLWFAAPVGPPGEIDAAFYRWLPAVNILIPMSTLGVMTAYFRIASVRVERDMEGLAMSDALTGLPNRRCMWQLLQKHGRGEFSLLLADIDHFKAINDSLGHDAGDRVLRAVTTRLSEELRHTDVLARWGGEEFLLLLPATSGAKAIEIAERLRHAVSSEPVRYEDTKTHLTITLGLAEHIPDAPLDATLRAADAALYRGKEAGRDRVVAGTLATERRSSVPSSPNQAPTTLRRSSR
jgi:diguanylate cyclase (GGDEF)-like protein